MIGGDLDDKMIAELWTEEENARMDAYISLRDSVAAIPASLMEETAELRKRKPNVYESLVEKQISAIGNGFYPKEAVEFVKVLNMNIERTAALND